MEDLGSSVDLDEARMDGQDTPATPPDSASESESRQIDVEIDDDEDIQPEPQPNLAARAPVLINPIPNPLIPNPPSPSPSELLQNFPSVQEVIDQQAKVFRSLLRTFSKVSTTTEKLKDFREKGQLPGFLRKASQTPAVEFHLTALASAPSATLRSRVLEAQSHFYKDLLEFLIEAREAELQVINQAIMDLEIPIQEHIKSYFKHWQKHYRDANAAVDAFEDDVLQHLVDADSPDMLLDAAYNIWQDTIRTIKRDEVLQKAEKAIAKDHKATLADKAKEKATRADIQREGEGKELTADFVRDIVRKELSKNGPRRAPADVAGDAGATDGNQGSNQRRPNSTSGAAKQNARNKGKKKEKGQADPPANPKGPDTRSSHRRNKKSGGKPSE